MFLVSRKVLLGTSFCQAPKLLRLLYNSSLLRARHVNVDSQTRHKRPTNRPTRQEKIDMRNMISESGIFNLDNKFRIFDRSVTRVLDLGFVPGNWSLYSKSRLCDVHGISEEDFHRKCYVLGFDMLVGGPLPGISTVQGNIFSKLTHQRILQHFKEYKTSKHCPNQSLKDLAQSYFTKEHNHSSDSDSDSMTDWQLNSNTLDVYDYKPQLILSDLGPPFMQQFGFFCNTVNRPHIRFHSSKALSSTLTKPLKSSIDLADATILLCCDILQTHGRLVLRLNKVDLGDPEMNLLQSRLRKMFQEVQSWHPNNNLSPTSIVNDYFYICSGKRDNITKEMIF